MTPAERLAWAQRLLDRADAATAGVWPRAAALLTRQALEGALDEFWAITAPPVRSANRRAQALGLYGYATVRALAPDVNVTFASLSRACHHHPYELPPTRDELEQWLRTVDRFRRAVSRIGP